MQVTTTCFGWWQVAKGGTVSDHHQYSTCGHELLSYVEVRGGTRGRASGLGDGNDVIDMVTERKSGRYCQDSAQ